MVQAWTGGSLRFGEGSTYGIVARGQAKLTLGRQALPLPSNWYFQASDAGTVQGGEGLLIRISGFPARPTRVGMVPDAGSVPYTPGGQLFQLIHPDRYGEPSLNMLMMAPNLSDQIDHQHNSLRVNVILSGSVICHTHTRPPQTLVAGDVIVIPANQHHQFFAGPHGMRFVAFHPDSKYGPTEKNNTLINNTFS